MSTRMKADMHVPAALSRWTVRALLALVVAGAIAYIPAGGVDDRATRLRQQLDAKKSARTVVELVDACDHCWQERPPEFRVQLSPEVRSLYVKGREAHIWREVQ